MATKLVTTIQPSERIIARRSRVHFTTYMGVRSYYAGHDFLVRAEANYVKDLDDQAVLFEPAPGTGGVDLVQAYLVSCCHISAQ